MWTGDDRLKRHGDRLSAADSIPPWQWVVALIHTDFGVVIREARRIIQVFAAWHSG
jgi:hypothetical protein